MKKIIFASLLALFLTNTAQSDQATVEAIEFAGGMLSPQQQRELANTSCSSSGCDAIVNKVGEIIGKYSDDDLMIEAILTGASNAYPSFATEFGETAMMTAPGSIDTIASVMMETAPTAAGPSDCIQ